MKKIALFFIISIIGLLFIQCNSNSLQDNRRKLLKEIIIEYAKTDSAYIHYGTIKEVYRIYNCEYKVDRISETRSLDLRYGIMYFINKFGDTIKIQHIDYINYPKRKE